MRSIASRPWIYKDDNMEENSSTDNYPSVAPYYTLLMLECKFFCLAANDM